ncbi:hypothetical protein BAE44_0005635 [Dichanthelium oligosanthes]|uniref:Transcription elongation factor 1 homolog n=1 Tax=Dichanthelium oligosanthes TaxID=888268 RepID=A0A1E5W7F2_9POAL|nr:hypothetical protein BAE44_0005635 [Dichanthelium oligosanthes]
MVESDWRYRVRVGHEHEARSYIAGASRPEQSFRKAKSWEKKARQRNPTRSVLLSDELSRLLLRAQSVENAGSIGAPEVSAAPTKKAQKKLDMVFRCPICKRDETVRVPDRPQAQGRRGVVLGLRGASYSTAADALTEPIDVYCEWIDERRRANKGGGVVGMDYNGGDVIMVHG